MEMAQDHSALIYRLQKLLELSRSSNPHEAAIALRRATKLMAEHQLTLDDLSRSAIEEKTEDIPSALRDRGLFTRLAAIVGRAFGVHFFFVSIGSVYRHVTFIGPRSRLESACYTWTIMSRQACIVKKQYAAAERKSLAAATGGPVRLTRAEKEFYRSLQRSLSTGQLNSHTLPPAAAAAYRRIDKLLAAERRLQSTVRARTKAYMEGWLSAVLQQVHDFALSAEEKKLIADFTCRQHQQLGSLHQRKRLYTQDQLAAWQRGRSDGATGFRLHQAVYGTAAASLDLKEKD